MKQGGGMPAVSAYAHKRGMTFGLWVEIESAGANSTLKQAHPDWLMTRNGQPIAGGKPGPIYRKLSRLLVDDIRHNRKILTRVF